jgi:endonuclease-3
MSEARAARARRKPATSLAPAAAPLDARRRRAFFARLARANPTPTTELRYSTPFELLVAVILSAQATDKSVNRATAALFKVADTPAAMVRLGVRRLERYIKSIGLYRTKARHIIETSRRLLERHGGQVPSTRAELEALPGVGRKTANVILNTAFGQPTIAVDTHIFRVANRTGLAPGKTPRQVEAALEKLVPARYRRHAHHWLILHGRYICTARRPHCERCPVSDLCGFPGKREAGHHRAALARRRTPQSAPAGEAGEARRRRDSSRRPGAP